MEEYVIFEEEARMKLQRGANLLKNSVKGTLGPCGHHAILQKEYGVPVISNDGVRIAKSLHLADPFEEMGSRLLLQAAIKSNEVAGDGTTTSIILAYEMLKQGYAYMKQGGMANSFVEGMEQAGREISTYLKEMSHKIDTYEGIHHVARISAKSEEIGSLVADALKQVEDPRCVYCESGKSYESKIRIQEGMEVEAKVLSPYFFPKDQKTIVLKQPYILISNERIDSLEQIEKPLAYALAQHRPLLILCMDMENDVLGNLLLAHMQKKCNVIVCKAPSFGSYQLDILEDLAVLCKGECYASDLGRPLENIIEEQLGSCREIVITSKSMHVFANTHEEVKQRIDLLKEQVSSLSQNYDIQHMYHRITRLKGKIAVLEVGGYTPNEIEEKKMRYEDAIQAANASMEEGIVAGGGLSFIQCYRKLQPLLHSDHKDMEAGIQCVFAAILKPFLQLMENNDEDAVAMLGIQFEKPHGIGYDVLHRTWCDMLEVGILDPLKVVNQTLHNAISIASLLIRCDVALLNKTI